ncbi:hypothetical protein FNV43_RR27089 [Rhamnella rubrinervis]|uniref:Uncharacterized protein n=1 Tax=Rhamnella rubrinervis TaxID=2594499 RepID=A0A8K0DQL2_9ROSA|nr:hypothetical protein FNV43_RR27089 [Rhamnella rubrinervis]
MSSQESHTHPEPYLVYSDPSFDSTPPLSSTSSSVRVVEPDQSADQNPTPYAKLSVRRDNPEEHRPKFFIQHPILIKTDIPSIFKPKDMLYLKEKYGFPHCAILSALRKGERADSVHDGSLNLSARLLTNPEQNDVIDQLQRAKGRSLHSLLFKETLPSLATDMRKIKVRVPIDAELAEKERKKKEKKTDNKASGSAPTQDPELTLGGTSETDLKLAKKEEELRNLRLDFSRIAFEWDGLQMRAAAWLSKKKNDYRKGVEDAFFKISFDEDDPEGNVEDEKTPSTTRDSFMEAMDAVRVEGIGPTANTGEASSAVQLNLREPY